MDGGDVLVIWRHSFELWQWFLVQDLQTDGGVTFEQCPCLVWITQASRLAWMTSVQVNVCPSIQYFGLLSAVLLLRQYTVGLPTSMAGVLNVAKCSTKFRIKADPDQPGMSVNCQFYGMDQTKQVAVLDWCTSSKQAPLFGCCTQGNLS